MADLTKHRGILFLAVLAAALLRLAGGYLPFERVWGVATLASFSLAEQLVWTLLPVLLALPRVQERVEALLLAALRLSKTTAGNLAALLFLLLAALVLLFPMDTFFYGDGGLLIPQIHRLAAGQNIQWDIVLNYKSSPLAGALLYLIAWLWPALLGLMGVSLPSHALYPFPLLGAFCALLLAVFFRALKGEPGTVLSRALLLLGGAGLLQFFGYAEFYLPVYVFVGIFLVLAERSINGRGSNAALIAAFVAAVAAHYYALVLLPALVYALQPAEARRGSLWSGRGYVLLLTAFSASILVTGLLSGMIGAASRFFIPVAPLETPAGTIYYTLFSRYHLVDILNILFLLAPFSVPVLAAMWIVRRRDAASDIFRFHVLATLPFLVFLTVAHVTLGFARDWDLTSPLGPLLLFLTVTALERGAPQPSKNGDGAGISVSFAVVMLVWTIPWILLHLDSDKTAARFERILALDEGHMQRDNAVSGYEALRKYHQNRGHIEKDVALSRKKIELLDYPSLYLVHLAKASRLAQTDPHRATAEHEWMLARLHEAAVTLRVRKQQRSYAISRTQIDSLAEAIAFQAYTERIYPPLETDLAALASVTGGTHPPPAVEALRLYEQKQYAEAIEAFQRLLNRNFLDPRIYVWQGTALALLGRYTEALAVFDSGITHFPNDTALLYTTARAYLSAGIERARAQSYLLHCLEIGVTPDREREIRRLLGG
ncbi:MAG: tetratricopeptide repeat protein [Ignavibacteriae bacterium]|nr:tetratricopeptide repeat protein [Ignavibacteriota bacterium]